MRINPAFREQFLMCAFLRNSILRQHQNPLCIPDCGQPVRNHEGCPVFRQKFQRFLDDFFAFVVGALLMTGGKLGAADLVTFLLYINNCTDPVKKLVNFTEQFQNGYSGYERFLEIMSIAPDIQDKPDALPLKNVQGEVTFENVSFHYEESKENVLSNVNLHVPAGDYVALVGSSGAGKTTLCSLLPRFYDVTEER